MLEQNELFGIGMNEEILSVQFGLFISEDLTAADGSVIPADGLLEIVNCNEEGNAFFTTDVPVGSKLYVKEISADNHYILPDEKYPVEFVYAGQEISQAEINEKYLDCTNELSSLECGNEFLTGFRLGGRMIMEIIFGADESELHD